MCVVIVGYPMLVGNVSLSIILTSAKNFGTFAVGCVAPLSTVLYASFSFVHFVAQDEVALTVSRVAVL